MEAFKGVSCTKQACLKAKVDKGSVHTLFAYQRSACFCCFALLGVSV